MPPPCREHPTSPQMSTCRSRTAVRLRRLRIPRDPFENLPAPIRVAVTSVRGGECATYRACERSIQPAGSCPCTAVAPGPPQHHAHQLRVNSLGSADNAGHDWIATGRSLDCRPRRSDAAPASTHIPHSLHYSECSFRNIRTVTPGVGKIVTAILMAGILSVGYPACGGCTAGPHRRRSRPVRRIADHRRATRASETVDVMRITGSVLRVGGTRS